VVDARFHALTAVRQAAATVLYPLQMAALMPRDAIFGMGAISRRCPRCRKKCAT
jgi:rod shape-determining protein MreC